MNDDVFLLWHVRQISGDRNDDKLVGVYRTRVDAEAAQRRLQEQPGFRNHPEGFEIHAHTLMCRF